MTTPDGGVVLPDAVLVALRAAVLDGTIAPGEAVTEAFVSRSFGVARPTARIAIDRLVAAGVLAREPHHSARVRELGDADVIDLFAARTAIESAAAEQLAAHATVPPAALAAHAQFQALADGASYLAADIAFHRALVHGSGSARLPKLHDLLMGEVELAISQIAARGLRTAHEVAPEHAAILDAISAGDAELAARLTRTHIHSSRDRLLAHLEHHER